MLKTEYILLIVGMGLVTYIPRYLPLFILAQRNLPRWFIEWLDMIPVAILSALVFSEIFLSGPPRHLDMLQIKSLVAIPTFLIALKTKSLGGTVISGMILFWMAGKIS
ncbi:MAG: AzlD domain-containing protein [Methanothrix sp.]|nr:AzlD domain-containing protein [Methanothrix sp.]